MDAAVRSLRAAVALAVVCLSVSGCGGGGGSTDNGSGPGASSPPPSTGGIPADRRTTWNPGIPGGIPARATVCATIQASSFGGGSADAAPAIQAAVDACPVGQVVQLSDGAFRIRDTISISRGVVLRGAGPAQTRLVMPVGTNANVVTLGDDWSFAESVSLAADAAKGTQSVALAGNPGLAANELVLIDQVTDPAISIWSSKSPPGDASRGWFTRPNRPLGQVMEVASISGNTVSFTTPFHIAFRTAFQAQLTRFSPSAPTRNAGLEDLYVSGGSQGQGNVRLAHAAQSWVRNVESDEQDGSGVAIEASFRCVLRDSFVHSTQNPTPGGGGYGIAVDWYSADNLIENNIVWNMNKVMVMRASGGGNVVAYNYMEDGWIDYDPGWVEVGLNASHMTCPHYELFEGNEAFNFDGDNTWGNAVYITVFRNHLTGKRRSVGSLQLVDRDNVRAVGLMEGHMWYTIVGNVLGSPNQNPSPYSSFTYEDQFPWDDDPVPMWRLGYNPENWGAAADSRVLSTLVRGGNFDYATNQVHWEGLSSQSLPDSLYLASKPAFFGGNPWPWTDPAGATKLYTLPARARFDASSH